MPRNGNYRRPAKTAGPPKTTEEAIDRIGGGAIKMFDKGDGEAAEWGYLANLLFLSSMKMIDKLPPRGAKAILRMFEVKIYDRLVDNEDDGLALPAPGGPADAARGAVPLSRPPQPRLRP